MEPEPEPEPQIQVQVHQFTEEWQGVRVNGLFALFTGTPAATAPLAMPPHPP
eukprot:COSAG04_NODE_13913_length_587_cov_1.065574_1_plen_52_part_00